ncbi:hypothetical protein [Chryseobacterium sp. JV274]|uniref:hypothetical protein n=1 Tax=Chryseobacterium sp. JV274 TaxID=1932669 RepID=UPI0015C22D7F|nr:hypothetical protein [Chryseobacterium sp. JV274]CAD0220364.1 protein of unknown function [Chryseobacterium sp. JV274]
MKITFKNYYVIQNINGIIMPHTLSYEKRACISNFIEGSSMIWYETKKNMAGNV